MNVREASRAPGGHPHRDSRYSPLTLLLPFVASTALQVAWLSHPEFNDSWIINSASFVPFVCAWGLQFAHQVGRMILAHVTGTGFPVWDWIWIWSVIGAVDANLPRLLNM
jgi:ethanolaminephosphotransferase